MVFGRGIPCDQRQNKEDETRGIRLLVLMCLCMLGDCNSSSYVAYVDIVVGVVGVDYCHG